MLIEYHEGSDFPCRVFVWASSKAGKDYHNEYGISAVSLLILQNIATTHGLQHSDLMYITYIT